MDDSPKLRYIIRKLINRGTGYKYSFFFAMIGMIIYFYLTEVSVTYIPHGCIFALCFFIPLTFCFVTLILNDGYGEVGSTKWKAIFSMFFFGGLAVFAFCVYKLLTENFSLYHDFVQVLASLCFTIIGATFYIKEAIRKKRKSEE